MMITLHLIMLIQIINIYEQHCHQGGVCDRHNNEPANDEAMNKKSDGSGGLFTPGCLLIVPTVQAKCVTQCFVKAVKSLLLSQPILYFHILFLDGLSSLFISGALLHF